MNEFNLCVKCGYKTTDSVADCPQCKGKMLNSRIMNRQGRLLAMAGACLVAMLSLILVVLLVLSDSNLTNHFAVPCVFGIGSGLAAIASGVWQIKYTRPNIILILIMLGLILAMVFRLSFGSAVGQSKLRMTDREREVTALNPMANSEYARAIFLT